MIEPPSPKDPAPLDVDSLARDKVDGIEKLLDSSDKQLEFDEFYSSFSVLKQIITSADLHRTCDQKETQEDVQSSSNTGDSIYAYYNDDNEHFNTLDLSEQFATNSVKWTIRVKAFKLLHKLVQIFGDPTKCSSTKVSITKSLPDLVRLSFVAASSPYDDLKMEGFEMFKFTINRFATLEDRELPGHSILEQYKTQVISALKPAFELDSPPYITAIACQVCSLWICKDIEKDEAGLNRFGKFMLSSLEKLKRQNTNQNSKLYTECELERERLDILGSWADLYIKSERVDDPKIGKKTNDFYRNSGFAQTVRSIDEIYVNMWWEALKDYALLNMSTTKYIGLNHDNEYVYTKENALRLFEPIWPRLLLSKTIWVCRNNLKEDQDTCDSRLKLGQYFDFLAGIIMGELCRCYHETRQIVNLVYSNGTSTAIKSLNFLVMNQTIRSILLEKPIIAQEFHSILSSLYIDRCRNKNPLQKLIKATLDLIFHEFTAIAASDFEHLSYATRYLLKQIDETLNHLEEIVAKSNSQECDNLVVKLSVDQDNLMHVLKYQPHLALDDFSISQEVTDAFIRILQCDANPSIAITFLAQLNILYSSLPESYTSKLLKKLYSAEISVASRYISQLKVSTASDQMSLLGEILNLLRLHLMNLPEDEIENPMRQLIETLVKSSGNDSSVASDNKALVSSRRNETFALCLRQLHELERRYPNIYNKIVIGDLKEALGRMQRPGQVPTGSSEPNKPIVPKAPPSKIGVTKRPTAKITLKADFSNFFDKKP